MSESVLEKLIKLEKSEDSEDKELLKWVWSIQDSLNLFDKHDAKWIEDAGSGWSDDSFYEFLKEYSLNRNFPRDDKDSREAFIGICEKHFLPKIDGEDWANYIGTKWREAYGEFAGWLSKNGHRKINLRSATLKAFWFYQPSDLVMYDKLACKGLERKLRDAGKKVSISDNKFLENFLPFHKNKENQGLRQKAKSYFDYQYPYEYRITDKYLWLMGNEKRDKILENFRVAIRAKGQWT